MVNKRIVSEIKELLVKCDLRKLSGIDGEDYFCFSKKKLKWFISHFIGKTDEYDYYKIDYESNNCTEFKLTPIEEARYKVFKTRHRHDSVEKGAIGGVISIEFMPTAIGNIIKCKCGVCGAEADITDIDNW